MPTNEILQFGTGGTVEDGDVLDLTVYEADPDRVGGVQPGIARRALFNTVMRQVTLMSAGVAEFIANRYEDGVVDDGDLAKIEAGLAAAISGMITAALPGQATTEGQGLVELATTSEAEAGADTTRAVTPAGLAAALAGLSPEAATTSTQGVVELATTAESEAGTDATRAVTPTGLAAAILAAAPSAATTALKGLVELATTTEAVTGTDATRAVTPAGLTAALSAALPSQYTSSLQTLVAGGTLSLSHGLGAAPVHFQASLVCQTAELGYTAGQEIFVGFHEITTAANGLGCVVRADSSKVYVQFGNNSSVFSIIRATDGNGAGITASYWKFRIRAWA